MTVPSRAEVVSLGAVRPAVSTVEGTLGRAGLAVSLRGPGAGRAGGVARWGQEEFMLGMMTSLHTVAPCVQ